MSTLPKTNRLKHGQSHTPLPAAEVGCLELDRVADVGTDPTKPKELDRSDRQPVRPGACKPDSCDPATRLVVRNLRHLRVFLAVLDGNSVSRGAVASSLSQPAATQAVAKLEAEAGLPLFRRTPQGFFPTKAGLVFARRARRALQRLDVAAEAISPRLVVTATASQLRALVAASEAENFTLAARRLGLTQAGVHRAVSDLEGAAAIPLFERTAHGLIATRPCQALADAARLAFAELDQAEMELAELAGREVGRIVVGAFALAQAAVLPRAIAGFRRARPLLPLRVQEAPYDQLLAALRRGEIDCLITALRSPAPISDVIQTPLFDDNHVVVAGPRHPLVGRKGVPVLELARYPFVVAEPCTPIRASFETFFERHGAALPASLVESGSLILMRQLLAVTDHLGWVSRVRAATEIEHGLVVELDVPPASFSTPVGLTTRSDWLPTPAQQAFLDCVMAAAVDAVPRS